MRYRAFISYSRPDIRWARWLHRSLERYRLPDRLCGTQGDFGPLPDRMTPIFRNRQDHAGAAGLSPGIEAALANSEALIVICSPAAARSQWVNSEVLAFKRMGRADRIYCLIVDGQPHAGDERECFPPAVHLDLDGNGELGTRLAEPAVADVRPHADGKRLARLKLLSGLLGVELDTLCQRDAVQHQRRLLAVTSLAVAVSLITSVVAIQAVIARNSARHQQAQAETLVGAMLGTLSDKLSQVSRLDIMESVNDEATTYFQSLPNTDVTDQTLQQRAATLEKIGNMRRDQGDLAGARRSYQAAENLAAQLAGDMPADLHRQLAHAKMLAGIGTTYAQQGQLDASEHHFIAAKTRLANALTKHANNPELLYQRATLSNQLGRVREDQGHLEQALAEYRSMLSAAGQLAKIDPSNHDWLAQSGEAHNNLARMALLRGDLPTAVAEYQADLEIQLDLTRRDPQNTGQAQRVASARAALGQTLALTGAVTPGIAQLRQSLDAIARLLMVAPQDPSFLEDDGLHSLQLAYWMRTNGDLEGARALAGRGLAVFEQLSTQNPANPAWQRALAIARIEQAEHAIAWGERMVARDHLHAALHLLEIQLAEQPDSRDTLLADLRATLLLAAVSDDPPIATKLRRQALATTRTPGAGRGDPRLLAFQAEALLELGQIAEARAVLPILWRTGFRDPRFMARLQSQRLPGPVAVLNRAQTTGVMPH